MGFDISTDADGEEIFGVAYDKDILIRNVVTNEHRARTPELLTNPPQCVALVRFSARNQVDDLFAAHHARGPNSRDRRSDRPSSCMLVSHTAVVDAQRICLVFDIEAVVDAQAADKRRTPMPHQTFESLCPDRRLDAVIPDHGAQSDTTKSARGIVARAPRDDDAGIKPCQLDEQTPRDRAHAGAPTILHDRG